MGQVASQPETREEEIGIQETIREITGRLIDFYRPVRIICSDRRRGAIPGRTAILTSASFCRKMLPRVFTATGVFTGTFGA
jgi:hypothetical protein